MEESAPAKILVLRGGALGDFIVTLPALVALRNRWPVARIELVGNADAAGLARSRYLLDAVHSQHEARWSALYSPHGLPHEFSQWLASFDVIVSFWPDKDGSLAHHFPIRPSQRFIASPAMPATAPASSHYLDALRSLGISLPGQFCRIFADRITLGDSTRSGMASSCSDTIAIHPGSGSPRKNWPASRWLQVIDHLAAPILLILGPAEAATWRDLEFPPSIAQRRRDGSIRTAINLTLEQLVAELARCRLFLGNDSGVSHLAAACGVPCILLFGASDPAIWAPPAPHVTVVRGGPEMTTISVAEILERIRVLGA